MPVQIIRELLDRRDDREPPVDHRGLRFEALTLSARTGLDPRRQIAHAASLTRRGGAPARRRKAAAITRRCRQVKSRTSVPADGGNRSD